MPVISEIDEENEIIIRKVIGALTIADVRHALESTPQLHGFKPGMGTVWDYGDGTISNFSTEELNQLVGFIKQWTRTRGVNYRVAAYAPHPVDYGLSRVYQALLEFQHVAFEFSVFSEMEAAKKWVAGIRTTDPSRVYTKASCIDYPNR